MEKLAGQSHGEFVAQNICKSLGMNASGYDSHSAIIPRRASGYSPEPNDFFSYQLGSKLPTAKERDVSFGTLTE
jgi:CubicO group peptidase (beta-lactamase class C family)